MKYPFVSSPKQTIEYCALHALETRRYTQAHEIAGYLNSKVSSFPPDFDHKNVSAALQRLKKADLVTHIDGRWVLNGKGKTS